MAHRWKFARIGGFDQVEITSGADLEALEELDQKLWVALACPTTGTELDERTLALIDTDGDGRIRAPELLAAVKWACSLMKDTDELTSRKDGLAIDAIDDDDDEGQFLVKTAREILDAAGKPDTGKLLVDDASAALASFEKRPLNGDGIVPETAAPDEATRALVRDALSCTAEPDRDRGGDPGLSAASAAAFFEAIDAHAAWLAEGADPTISPLGDATPGAHAAFAAVRAKLDDYFARAAVAAYDARALAAVNGEEKLYVEICARDLSASAAELEALPIGQVAAGKPLPLEAGVNPAWAARVAAFREQVVLPLLGARTSLTGEEFAKLCGTLAPHAAWLERRAGASVEKLGAARVRELSSGDARKTLDALIAQDLAMEPARKALEAVEKLVRLKRDLLTLVNNFVSFRYFYSRRSPAIFQVGTLYLDQRACELCVSVSDATRHALMAPLSNAYLVYADIKNARGETKQIAAAMMAGDVDNLMVGRNGIFYDRKGLDWDATVTKIIENPLSVRQAFWSPYKKVLRAVEDLIAKRAADEAKASDAATAGAVQLPKAPAAGPAPAAPPAGRKLDVGTIAALGVGVGGIAAAFGALLSAFFGLGFWMPLGVLGLMLCISGPSMAVAWLKLRKRNLGPLLDANGWAVNARALVNLPLGRSLTKTAKFPPGSTRSVNDPFAEKPRPWGLYALGVFLVAVLVSWYLGKLDGFMPSSLQSVAVLGDAAPAAASAPAPSGAAPAASAP
jgi:hypothetical protein